jgi:hypothetical protein
MGSSSRPAPKSRGRVCLDLGVGVLYEPDPKSFILDLSFPAKIRDSPNSARRMRGRDPEEGSWSWVEAVGPGTEGRMEGGTEGGSEDTAFSCARMCARRIGWRSKDRKGGEGRWERGGGYTWKAGKARKSLPTLNSRVSLRIRSDVACRPTRRARPSHPNMHTCTHNHTPAGAHTATPTQHTVTTLAATIRPATIRATVRSPRARRTSPHQPPTNPSHCAPSQRA